LRGAQLAHPLSNLLGIEAHQTHEGLITEQQRWQGIHTFEPTQGLQAIQQDIRDKRHHLALDRRALNVPQQVDHSQLVQEVEEVIQQGPFVQAVDSIDDLLPIQATRDTRIVASGHLPTQAFR
jgi:hypothetical protein